MNGVCPLENSKKRHPEKVALIFEGHVITYENLNDVNSKFAKRFEDIGL